MKKLILLLLCLLLCGCAMAEESALPAGVKAIEPLPAGVVRLPIDFSPGLTPQEDGYAAEGWHYEDPSITVDVETGRTANCDYWIATVSIADASQLRTMSAGGFDSKADLKGQQLAKRANAVLAINGDYFCYTGEGFILRQGILYRNKLRGIRDVLCIDEDGDFHGYFLPNEGEVPEEIDGKKVINAFYFGPILVYDGQVIEKTVRSREEREVMAGNDKKQRMAICQTGPLQYKLICTAGPTHGNRGMTMQQFAEFVAAEHVQIAYNLDGGDSTMLMLNCEKLNNIRSTSTRKLVDIIYFASAYDPEAVQ